MYIIRFYTWFSSRFNRNSGIFFHPQVPPYKTHHICVCRVPVLVFETCAYYVLFGTIWTFFYTIRKKFHFGWVPILETKIGTAFAGPKINFHALVRKLFKTLFIWNIDTILLFKSTFSIIFIMQAIVWIKYRDVHIHIDCEETKGRNPQIPNSSGRTKNWYPVQKTNPHRDSGWI